VEQEQIVQVIRIKAKADLVQKNRNWNNMKIFVSVITHA